MDESKHIKLNEAKWDKWSKPNSFHHYLHPEKAMGEISRLLKTGGRIYILDPAADTWFIKAIDKVAKLFEPEHVKIYSSDEFKRLMISAGLQYKGFETILAHQKVQIGEK